MTPQARLLAKISNSVLVLWKEVNIMTVAKDVSLASVYTSPVDTEAELVRSLLLEHATHATVAESNGSFAGLLICPSEVWVCRKDETRAPSLIAQVESRQLSHVGLNDVQLGAE